MPITRDELSERELEILRLVATGASNKEIASRLFISANTVKVHLRNIFTKIGVVSRTEATLYALKNGLVDPSYLPKAEEAPPIDQQPPFTNITRLLISDRPYEITNGLVRRYPAPLGSTSCRIVFISPFGPTESGSIFPIISEIPESCIVTP